MKKRKFLVRILFYIMGMLTLALGLTLNAQAHLGVAPIVSLPYTVALILDMNFGNIVFVSYLLFVSVQLLITKKRNRILILLQIPTSLIFTRVINAFDLFFNSHSRSTAVNVLLLLAAILLIGTGAAWILSVKLVPNPADGIVSALAEYFHKSIGLTKNVFDFFSAFIALTLGWISGNPFLGVGVGTIICVFGVGRVFAIFNRYAEPWIRKQTGLSENRKEDEQIMPQPLGTQSIETAELAEEQRRWQGCVFTQTDLASCTNPANMCKKDEGQAVDSGDVFLELFWITQNT